MIIFIYIMIYHVLKEYKNNVYIVKKFENKFIIDEWFQFWKKVTILLIFEKWFNFQTSSGTFVKKRIVMFIKRVEKTKWKLQKCILKLIDWKKKKLKNNDDKFIHFFYKDSFNDLYNIKNSNFKYELKRRQKRKKSFSSIKKEEFEINIEKKILKR